MTEIGGSILQHRTSTSLTTLLTDDTTLEAPEGTTKADVMAGKTARTAIPEIFILIAS